MEKARELKKKSTSASFTTLKPLTIWITRNWKILIDVGVPDHLTCLLRKLNAGQEAPARMDMEKLTGPNWERSLTRLYTVTLLI